MTVDIKCPHCGEETDYNLKYNEDGCDICGKGITFGEMYTGKPEVVKASLPITANSVLYKDDFEKEIKYKYDVYRFGSISKHFMDTQIKNHINVLHEVALRYDSDYDKSRNLSYGSEFETLPRLSNEIKHKYTGRLSK